MKLGVWWLDWEFEWSRSEKDAVYKHSQRRMSQDSNDYVNELDVEREKEKEGVESGIYLEN